MAAEGCYRLVFETTDRDLVPEDSRLVYEFTVSSVGRVLESWQALGSGNKVVRQAHL